jgi:hypothetical protein
MSILLLYLQNFVFEVRNSFEAVVSKLFQKYIATSLSLLSFSNSVSQDRQHFPQELRVQLQNGQPVIILPSSQSNTRADAKREQAISKTTLSRKKNLFPFVDRPYSVDAFLL